MAILPGKIAMLKILVPQGPLKDFVGAILYLEDLGTGLALQRVYQNIIINAGDSFSTSDPFRVGAAVENKSTIWINGKHESPFYLENMGKPAFYVIGVRPGMLRYFISVPVSETNDKALPAEVWAQSSIHTLRDTLLRSNDIASNLLKIEDYFEDLIRHVNTSLLAPVQCISGLLPVMTAGEIARKMGYTRKRLWTTVTEHFGSSVKEMQGIIRFDRHLAAMAENPDSHLGDIHTFYDQAHFINDFKKRTGLTPKQYRQLCIKYPEIRHHPNFLPIIPKETFLQFYQEGIL
jgi:AraC-like DNA-binding protein